jgi:hypothetical protein
LGANFERQKQAWKTTLQRLYPVKTETMPVNPFLAFYCLVVGGGQFFNHHTITNEKMCP